MLTRPRPSDYLLLLLLAALWGSSFLFIKVAIADVGPLSLVAARTGLGALALWLVVGLSGGALPREARLWGHFAVIALVGNVVPFTLIAWGELALDSGLAAILMASMPVSAVLLTHLLTDDERLTGAKLLGVALGLAGVVALVGVEALRGLGGALLAQLAIVAAGACYALASIYTRAKRVTELSPAVTGAGVLLCSFAQVLPPALALERPWEASLSAQSLWSILALGLVCTGAAYLILFRLLARAGVTFVALNNYLVPLFGVLWGAALLGESLPASAFAALVLILLGVGLTRDRGRPPLVER